MKSQGVVIKNGRSKNPASLYQAPHVSRRERPGTNRKIVRHQSSQSQPSKSEQGLRHNIKSDGQLADTLGRTLSQKSIKNYFSEHGNSLNGESINGYRRNLKAHCSKNQHSLTESESAKSQPEDGLFTRIS